MFNNGVNPKKGGCMSDGSNIREEVAAIIYVSEVFHWWRNWLLIVICSKKTYIV